MSIRRASVIQMFGDKKQKPTIYYTDPQAYTVLFVVVDIKLTLRKTNKYHEYTKKNRSSLFSSPSLIKNGCSCLAKYYRSI